MISSAEFTDEERAAAKVSTPYQPISWQRSLGHTGWDASLDRCCASVHEERGVGFHQCGKKPKVHYGRLGYCATHDPKAISARSQARHSKYEKKRLVQQKRWDVEALGRKAIDALRLIADGHNDARGLAQELLAPFDEKWWDK